MSVIGSKSPRRTVNISCATDQRQPHRPSDRRRVSRASLEILSDDAAASNAHKSSPSAPCQSPTARQIAPMKAGHQLARDGAQNGGCTSQTLKKTAGSTKTPDTATAPWPGPTRAGAKSALAPNLRRNSSSCVRAKQRGGHTGSDIKRLPRDERERRERLPLRRHTEHVHVKFATQRLLFCTDESCCRPLVAFATLVATTCHPKKLCMISSTKAAIARRVH
jgi:hypothetical protein